MKTKSIFLLGLALLVLSGLQAQDKATKQTAKPEVKPTVTPIQAAPVQAAPENPNAAELKFETEEHNFGNIKQGDMVNYEFKFVNVGKEPLIISNATGSCGCTVPDWPKDPIKPGANGMIKVSFNSAGKSGIQDKTVTITSNAKSSTKVIHIKGNVEAPAATPNVTPAPVKVEPAPVKK